MDLKLNLEDMTLAENEDGIDLELVIGEEEIRQLLTINLQIWKREYFANQNLGVDWARILGQKRSTPLLTKEVQDVIISTRGVKSISTFSADLNTTTREMTVSFRATIYSDITLDFRETLTI